MARRVYEHSFDVVIRKSFESYLGCFDQAFSDWAAQFPTEKHLRDELLESESLESITDSITHVETDEITD